MPNWYSKFKQSSYSNEIASLRDYLESGFDPYDYQHKIKDFLEYNDLLKPEWEDLESFDIFEEWINSATDKDKKDFSDYVHNNNDEDEYYKPAYESLDFKKLAKPQWLVHFTDDPHGIKNNGFIYGNEDFEGLHLTTWKKNRKKHPGYNFALELDRGSTKHVAREGKYGKHCVIFWGASVEAYHYGDEEYQMIFWGPSIRLDMIFVMLNDGNEWCVPSFERDCVKRGSFEECSDWIINNYRMLQQIEEKSKRYIKNKQKNKLY